jgi:carbonic anhydrase
VLKVKHVIVCGHYGCGGVLAAMGNQQFGLIDNWLRHIKDVYDKYKTELNAIADETERGRRFVELNVTEQVYDLSKTSIIQNSWKNHQRPSIHGWVYDLKTGIIKDLNVLMDGMEDVSGVYKFDDAK